MKTFLYCLLVMVLMSGAAYAQVPAANFSASQVTACNPAVISFTDLSTGNPTSWSWNFGNSNTSTLQNPSTSYLAPGTYTVTLTVTNANGSNTKTITGYIQINSSPTVAFTSSDSEVCPGSTINFTSNVTLNSSGTGAYLWNLNGSSLTTQNASYTYYTSGSYVASLFVSNNIGCTTSVSHNITVYQKPATTVSANPQHMCHAGDSTTFTATTTGTGPYTYYWTFGDGGTGTGASAVHIYAAPGSYNVSVITTDGHSCKDTLNLSNFTTVTQVTPAFSSTAPMCLGLLTAFTNTSGTISSQLWDFGDGGVSSISPTYHNYAAAGTYNVKLKVSSNGCTDSVIHPITIWPKPSVSFIDTPHHPCPPPSTIQFNNTTTGATSYDWTFGDGNSSNNASPAHTYATKGVYHIMLTATSANGCTDSLSRTDSVYDAFVIITYNPTGGCIPFNVNFSYAVYAVINNSTPAAPYPYPAIAQHWDFGDGTSSTLVTPPPHTYSIYGSYPVTLTLTMANGCTFIKIDTVHAGTPPTADFSASPDTVCIHSAVAFTNLSSANSTNWLWDFGDGVTSSVKNPINYYTHAGVFSVKLSTYNNGCLDTMRKDHYIVVLDPESKFTVGFSCLTPKTVTFTNLSTSYTSLIWYFGDGTTSTAISPTHTYAALGLYPVSLVTHNSTTDCSDSFTVSVYLIQLVPDFVADDTTICLGTSSTFTSTTTGGAVLYYYWTIDGVPLSDTEAVVHYTFGTPGYHTIKMGVKDDHGCITYITKTNYVVVGHPGAAWTAQPPIGCAPATIVFTDATNYPPGTSGVSRHWDFGDATSSTVTGSTVSHLYVNPGTYDISLKVTDNIGCTDSISSPGGLLINKVIANFTVANTIVCVGVPLFFQNTTSGNNLQYAWDFGDGTTSTATSPLHTYTAAGVYTVKLAAYDNAGCGDSIVKTSYITVQAKPSASFTLSDTFSICPPLLVQTNNTSTGGTQYLWTFGNGSSSYLTNPAITYGASGIYDVLLIVSNLAGCKDTAKGRVRILGYAGLLSYSPLTGCAPLTVTFNALNVAMVPGFVFDFADGFTTAATTTTVSHTYTQAGPYVPKLLMTNNAGCTSSSIGLDTIKVDGIQAGFTYSPYPACANGNLTFIDTSYGLYSPLSTHLWQFHDGTSANGPSANHYYATTGTYNVTLIMSTVAGCKDTLHSSVTFWSLPIISAGIDTTICLTDSATLLPSGGVSYIWSPATSLSCTACTNPKAYPILQTQYSVTGTDTHGCRNTDSITVSIKTKTEGLVGTGGEVCQGVPVQLTASGGTAYQWIPGSGLNNSQAANPVATPLVSTHYMVITTLAACVPDTDYVDVIIHPLPLVDAGSSQTIIAGNIAQLQGTGSAYITHWAWSPEEWLSCVSCPAPEATPKHTITFTIVAATDFNCTASDTVTVFVICDNSQVFVPNTFTPDGNGYNDRFYVHGKGIETIRSFRIYDRWGELVFERRNIGVNDQQQGWDGTFKGTALPPDTYIYLVDAVCDTGEPVMWKGDVMLLR